MISCRAYAKVNLCLAVSPPEPAGSVRAGWHRIASWFAAVELWDEVVVERGAGSSLYSRDWAPDAPRPAPIDWAEEKDLAVRAHRLLEQVAGRALPIRLGLRKRIPTGGGLGGGSSDAAAVLRAVAALFDLPLTTVELRRLAGRLGSDVGYFIGEDVAATGPGAVPVPACVTGFGDVIAPAGRGVGGLTLILPEFGCPTPAVYRAFDSLGPREFRDAEVARLAEPDRAWSGGAGLFNDLGPAAELIEPRLASIRGEVEAGGHSVHMSGSGSTLFVLGDEQVRAPEGCVVVRTRFA